MMDLPFADCTWDFVVHSDTLEHVPDPLKGSIGVQTRASSRRGLRFHHSPYRWENDAKSEGLASKLPRLLSESRGFPGSYGIWRRFLGGDLSGGIFGMPHFLIEFPRRASHRRSAVASRCLLAVPRSRLIPFTPKSSQIIKSKEIAGIEGAHAIATLQRTFTKHLQGASDRAFPVNSGEWLEAGSIVPVLDVALRTTRTRKSGKLRPRPSSKPINGLDSFQCFSPVLFIH